MLAHRPRSSGTKIFRSICTILPRRLDHLRIDIMSVDDIETISEWLVQLSSVAFELSRFATISTAEIMDWLKNHVMNFSFRMDGQCVYVWLGKYINKPSEIKVGPKRVKLTHNSFRLS
jgi:hypothetical protein